MAKIVKILIDDEGSVEVDQVGYKGKSCQGEVADLINALGEEKKTIKKPEYHKGTPVKNYEQRF